MRRRWRPTVIGSACSAWAARSARASLVRVASASSPWSASSRRAATRPGWFAICARARQPAKELAVTVRRSRKPRRAEQRAALIKGGGMVSVGMRVDPAITSVSWCFILYLPSFRSERAARSGRADTTVTRHLSRAGSYQLTRRPTRPPRCVGVVRGDLSALGWPPLIAQGQFMRRSDPRPDADLIFTVCATATVHSRSRPSLGESAEFTRRRKRAGAAGAVSSGLPFGRRLREVVKVCSRGHVEERVFGGPRACR
jgi:hypothetical protein